MEICSLSKAGFNAAFVANNILGFMNAYSGIHETIDEGDREVNSGIPGTIDKGDRFVNLDG